MHLEGSPVSGGVALGEIFVYKPFTVKVGETLVKTEQRAAHRQHFAHLRKAARQELAAIAANLEQSDPEKAKIFEAHQDIVDDAAMVEEIEEGIAQEGWAAEWAVEKIFGKFTRMLEQAPDPLIQQRAADLADVRARLLRLHYGHPQPGLAVLPGPVVVAARDLLPSDAATLDRQNVLAILTEAGGHASHTAIIARAYGIPAIVGITGLLAAVRPGQSCAVDAVKGQVVLDPDPACLAEHGKKREAWHKKIADTEQYLDKEPFTADGVRIQIGLNIGACTADELAPAKHTDGAGLFRTEFLYMGRASLPGEEEQYRVYKRVLEAYGQRPVVLRTLDIGGDKTLDCMSLPKEDNPFLGKRALRFSFSRVDIFETQLRAALRAAAHGQLWLMLPMVGSMDDIRKAKAFVEKARVDLAAEGAKTGPIRLGIMVEIPSIALLADKAAREVDFASIGTNDLCQYLTAADRLNPDVAEYYQSYHPALLRLVQQVALAFDKAGKPVSVCGELAGDPLAAPVLVGLGVRSLSMGAGGLAAVKRVLGGLTLPQMQAIGATVIDLDTAAEVEHYLRYTIPG